MMTLLFAERIRTSKQNALGLIGSRAGRINDALPFLFFGLFNRNSSSEDGQINEGMTHVCPCYGHLLETIRGMHRCVLDMCKTHCMSPHGSSQL